MLLGGQNHDLKTQYFPAALGFPKYDAEHNLANKWVAPKDDRKNWAHHDTGLGKDLLGVLEKEIVDEATRETLFDYQLKEHPVKAK